MSSRRRRARAVAPSRMVMETFTSLEELDLSCNWIGDPGARALAKLTGLASLDLGDNKIDGDLTALEALTALRKINLSGAVLTTPMTALWRSPALQEAILKTTRLPGAPPEILSEDYVDNCLPQLRAHLEAGGSR